MALAQELPPIQPQPWPLADSERRGRRRHRGRGTGAAGLTMAASGHLEVVESQRLDEARLDGVRLAAREMAHLLNNDLAVPVGALDLLCEDASLPPRLRDIVEQGRGGLNDAAEHVFRLQQLIRFETKKTPIGPALDLDRSARHGARRQQR